MDDLEEPEENNLNGMDSALENQSEEMELIVGESNSSDEST
jgi:hypothetical protein